MRGKLHHKNTHDLQKTVDPKMVERATGNTQLSEKESARNPKCKLSEQGLFTLYTKNKTYFPFSIGHRIKWQKTQNWCIYQRVCYKDTENMVFIGIICIQGWNTRQLPVSPQFARVINDLLSGICTGIEKSLGPSLREYAD